MSFIVDRAVFLEIFGYIHTDIHKVSFCSIDERTKIFDNFFPFLRSQNIFNNAIESFSIRLDRRPDKVTIGYRKKYSINDGLGRNISQKGFKSVLYTISNSINQYSRSEANDINPPYSIDSEREECILNNKTSANKFRYGNQVSM